MLKSHVNMILVHVVLCFFIYIVNGVHIIELSDSEWILSSKNISFAVIIPISVHMALLKSGLINDPLVGYRDKEYSWIADQDWVFERNFSG